MSAYIKNRSISINPVIYLIRLLCLQVYLFWCSATLQPFKIWFVAFCLLTCNSASARKHSLQRSDVDFPYCRRLVCVGRVSKQELSRNFSVPFIRLNMQDFQIMSYFSSIARQSKCPIVLLLLFCIKNLQLNVALIS